MANFDFTATFTICQSSGAQTHVFRIWTTNLKIAALKYCEDNNIINYLLHHYYCRLSPRQFHELDVHLQFNCLNVVYVTEELRLLLCFTSIFKFQGGSRLVLSIHIDRVLFLLVFHRYLNRYRDRHRYSCFIIYRYRNN